MIPFAPIGAATTVAGMGLSAYGDHQATSAMRKAWGHANDLQNGYNAQLREKTNELIGGINPNGFLGMDQTNEMMPQLQNQSISLADAIRNHGMKRTGGSRSGAEVMSRVKANSSTTLADALRSGKLAAMLSGFQKGGRDTDLRSRQFALDSGNIRRDAQAMAQLATLWEQAAALKGGKYRQFGQLLQGGGQGLMMYGMAQAPGQPGMGTNQWGPDKIGDMTEQQRLYLLNGGQQILPDGGTRMIA